MNMFKPVKARSIKEYIDSIPEPRRAEIVKLDKFIKDVAPELKPHFAYNMLGYGSFHYKSKSGREGDWPVVSLASQKNYISVYVCSVENGKYVAENYGKKLGKVSVGKSCIRFKKMDDVKLDMLKEVIRKSVKSPGFEG
jgi:uncharacterized protein YdhG (YjbR/CyaY superfamily)